jgi:hypothetical protein
MSLINDALKRAHESQGNNPVSPPPLPPAVSQSSNGPGWILPAAIALLLAGGLLIWLALAHKSSKPAASPVTAAAIPAVPPVNPAPAVVAAPASQPAPTYPPAPVSSNVVSGFLPERFPKVQGIIYTPPQPVAIVNGKMVSVGDRLGHFLVKQINRNNVTFQKDDGTQKQMGVGE